MRKLKVVNGKESVEVELLVKISFKTKRLVFTSDSGSGFTEVDHNPVDNLELKGVWYVQPFERL
ncbi:hypothetical protein CWI37_0187p0010 [Hamiltosporidium tvaerminnensis]|uniref:Uncharacterized protein n=1 Tax=Hamiltosporidium tvaerminnensis TaxID=1176355 RepID=A0A4Q9L8P3_9MICR|nr:hypothetical protein CWI37_0187p0010 [Hamiltosporidium tvaerminnensis]